MSESEAPLPLEGIRVVDMSWMWAGPYCSLQLAHLGAEVVRIETPDRPCMNRVVPPYANDEPGLNRAGSFNPWNQGKLSVGLDLKRPEGRALAQELAAASDVLVENYSVGVVDRLGLGWEALHERNPRLVMISLSGYGLTGPYRDRVAFGSPLTMISGLGALSGYREHGPSEIGLSYADPNAALHGAFAVLAALWAREETGRGQYIDLSQWESLVSILPEGVLPWTMREEQPKRATNRDQLMAPHGIYPSRGEERWVGIAIRSDEEWRRLAGIVGGGLDADERFTSAPGRKQHEDDLDALLSAWTSARDRDDVVDSLQAAHLAAAPVMDMRDIDEDPHLNERGFFVELPHPETGPQRHAGIPWKLSDTPLAVRAPAPCLGADNEYVVKDLLGHSKAEYDAFAESGILR